MCVVANQRHPRSTSTGHYGHFIIILIFHLLVNRVDSTMLIEEGFQVVSVDASDKMLKYALKERWNRRRDPGFDDWSKVPQAFLHTSI